MAAQAQRDQEKRIIEVNREDLLTTLKNNRDQHIIDYNEAMSGYKSMLLQKIDSAFIKARKDIESRYVSIVEKVKNFTNEDIIVQRDNFTILDGIYVEMKVPRSYVEEYESAIDVFTWEVKPEVQLSYAEFGCFVRDMWDWQIEFKNISAMYKG